MQQGTMHDEIRKERGGGGKTIKERRQKEKINESKGDWEKNREKEARDETAKRTRR